MRTCEENRLFFTLTSFQPEDYDGPDFIGLLSDRRARGSGNSFLKRAP
jgi:hypothetical protein